jgi:hypothetical protein
MCGICGIVKFHADDAAVQELGDSSWVTRRDVLSLSVFFSYHYNLGRKTSRLPSVFLLQNTEIKTKLWTEVA